MAPTTQKRLKGVQIYRPFIYGTTAKLFDPIKNPKPAGIPENHTHSWTVFVKGVDDVDITYWLKKVQFKLHESIPEPMRNIEAEPGQPFEVHETGWGDFEIQIRFHFVSESSEKPCAFWHQLRLHHYGTEAEQSTQREEGTIRAWQYDEVLFNEPYEPMFEILTGGGNVKPAKNAAAAKQSGGARLKSDLRTATIPAKANLPEQPYSREMEILQIKELEGAHAEVMRLLEESKTELASKEERIATLKAELGV